MIRQHSQAIRVPEKPVTPFGRQLQEALERAQAQHSQAKVE
jgi:hypothetical protein